MTEQNEQVEKRTYMSISFPNIPEEKSQEIAKWLVDNTPGLSFNVFYDDPMQDEESEEVTRTITDHKPQSYGPGAFQRYTERGLDGGSQGR